MSDNITTWPALIAAMVGIVVLEAAGRAWRWVRR